MLFEMENTGDLNAFTDNLTKITGHSEMKAALVLVCDENGWGPEELDPLIAQQPMPVFGGVFPRLVAGKAVLNKGSIVIGVISDPQIAVIKGLSDPNADYEELIDMSIGAGFDDPSKTIADTPSQSRIGSFGQTSLVMVDAFSTRIASFIEGLFNVLGVEENYIGGGAGSLSLKQKPCLITPDGMLEDAALLVGFDWCSGVGLAHGWDKVAGPFVVTESEGNEIQTINWRPAVEVYRETLEGLLGGPVTNENFLSHAMSYPLGVARLGGSHIVRDPLAHKEGSIFCFGDVPLESHVDILHSDKERLIQAAAEAKDKALALFPPGVEPLGAFVIDCISRLLFLGEDYAKEVEAVQMDNMPVFGVLSLGEIANKREEYLEFYNKTTVVGIVGEV
ncbi:MAG: histidine kinase [Myxococcales bacterium]|nr:histidine kinase [Myxococcales bacterium]